MNTYNKESMLIKTFIELDYQISNIAQMILADRYVEVGDDPRLVQKIEKTLTAIDKRVNAIASYFDLSIISLSQANYYFDLIQHVDDALSYLREIRRKEYGSRQHTRELLEKLENCSKSIFVLSDLVSVNSEVVH